MVTVIDETTYEFRGLSTDTKPIGINCTKNANVAYPISNGSVFFEMDTSKTYMFSISTIQEGTITKLVGTWILLS